MRVAVLPLLVFSLLLQQASLARADDIDSRRGYVVNGEPAGQGDIRGTVAVALLSEEQAQEGFLPDALFSGQWCTGVLIAPTVVLTAGHCVEQCFWRTCGEELGEPYDCYLCDPDLRPVDRIFISAGSRTLDDMRSAEVVPVRELFVPVGYVPSADWFLDVGVCEPLGLDDYKCEKPGLTSNLHDIAVLLLDAPVTALNPVRILPRTDDLAGTEGLVIGYGLRAQVGSDELLGQDRYLSVLNQTSTLIEEVTEQDILTAAGENHSGVCFGDSGGPLYVQRGGELFVAGIASRFRADADAPKCGAGAIHTSATAYADWIFEKAPEANRLTLGGGGGCSSVNRTASQSGAWLMGLLLLVLCFRARRKVLFAAPFVLAAGTLIGCGSSTGNDVSFCNETRDPWGIFCDPDIEMIEMRPAEAIARSEVPEDALLWMVRSSSYGLLDPDGRADFWRFGYYLPGRRELPEAEFREVTVFPEMTFVTDRVGSSLTCIPTEPIPVLDSRQLTHDAIRFMEAEGTTVRLGDGKNLYVVQRHLCHSGEALRNSISYTGMTAYFDDNGTFFKLEEAH